MNPIVWQKFCKQVKPKHTLDGCNCHHHTIADNRRQSHSHQAISGICLLSYLIPVLIVLLMMLPAAGWAGDPPKPLDSSIQIIQFTEEPANVVEQRHRELLQKAESQGSVPVIVRLREDLLPEARLGVSGIQQQRKQLNEVQERVLNQLSAIQSRSPQQRRFNL